MKRGLLFSTLVLGIYMLPHYSYSQEKNEIDVEESAEVFLEDYSDDFQENFFEGLKQKGIQNYDRAVIFLLECQKLQPDNKVVAHELAKTYLLDKKYIQAQEYATEALSGEPENYWYLNTLISILEAQKTTFDMVKEEVPMDNIALKENLAQIYFKNQKYKAALASLEDLPKSNKVIALQQKLKDSIKAKDEETTTTSFSFENNNAVSGTNDIDLYKTRIKGLMNMTSGNSLLLQVSEEALDSYPSQPYFYYTNGYALNRSNKHREAIEVLEAALDYLINDISLGNKIYKELSDAYNAISNPSKANMYLSKIKPGF